MRCFPGTFGHPRSMAAKMAQKKTNFFVMDTIHPNCHFSAADLCEIWRQRMNRCLHRSFYKRIAKFSRNGVICPQNRLSDCSFYFAAGFCIHCGHHSDNCNFSSCYFVRMARVGIQHVRITRAPPQNIFRYLI